MAETQFADLLDIIGTKINFSEDGSISNEEWNKLSKKVQAYSDKRYETARYFFVNKEGQIVRHYTASCQFPSESIYKLSDNDLYSLRQYATDNNYRIVFMHNHPSGLVAPSEADIVTTEKLENFFIDIDGNKRFLGHIIADHGNFGLYVSNEEKKWYALINDKFEDINKINDVYVIQNSKYKIRIQNEKDLTLLKDKAKELDSGNSWNKDKWIPCFFATHDGIIKSFEHINVNAFDDENFLKTNLKNIGRENNSDFIYFLPNTREQFFKCEAFAQKSGMIQNVYYEFPDGTHELSAFANGKIFNSITQEDIKIEDSDKLLTKEELNKILQEKKAEQETENNKIHNDSVIKEGSISKKILSNNSKENKLMENNNKNWTLTEKEYEGNTYKVSIIDVAATPKVPAHKKVQILTIGESPIVLSERVLNPDETFDLKDSQLIDSEVKNTLSKPSVIKGLSDFYVRNQILYQLENGISSGQYEEKDFNDMYNNRVHNYIYSDKQIESFEKWVLNWKSSENMADAMNVLKKHIMTNIAIKNGAAWEYDEHHNKVLKQSEPYSVEDKNNSLNAQVSLNSEGSKIIEENFDINDSLDYEKKSESDVEPSLSDNTMNIGENTENNKLDEILALLKKNEEEKEKLIKQNHSLQNIIDSMNQKIQQMEEQLNLYKSNVQMSNSEQVKEYGFSDSKASEQDIQTQGPQPDNFRPGSFHNQVAWTPGASVPMFGHLNEKTMKMEHMKGYKFARLIENEEAPEHNKVILENPDITGDMRTITLEESAYRQIIKENEKLERAKTNLSKDSWEWYQAHEEYRKNLHLDQHKLRDNLPENFNHNFKVLCEKANNYDDAMEMAKQLYDNLDSYGKNRLNQFIKSEGHEHFYKRLEDMFNEVSKDKVYSLPELFGGKLDVHNKSLADFAKENPADFELPAGSNIPNTQTVIGDTIKMAMTFKTIDGKTKKTPAANFKIIKVSKNINPDRAILYSEENKCSYVIPLTDLTNHIKKVEKTMLKEEKKKLKEEHKNYGYEGR